MPTIKTNLAINDTVPLPMVHEGKKSAYYGGGRERLAHTDTTKAVALRVTDEMRNAFKAAVKQRYPDSGQRNGDAVVLRALMEAYVAGEIIVAKTEYPPRGEKFPLGAKVVFLNGLVPTRVKEMFDDAVAAVFHSSTAKADSSDILREIVLMFIENKLEDLVVVGDGKSRFKD